MALASFLCGVLDSPREFNPKYIINPRCHQWRRVAIFYDDKGSSWGMRFDSVEERNKGIEEKK